MSHNLRSRHRQTVLLAAILALLATLLTPPAVAQRGRGAPPEPTPDPAQPVTIAIDAAADGWPLNRVWTYFGFDECNFATTEHAAKLMRTLATLDPASPTYLRCHFLFNSGDGVPSLKWGSTNIYTEDADGRPVYDFRLLDGIVDAQVAAGCRPLFQIMGMPRDLSSRPEPYKTDNPQAANQGWSQPPKDDDRWADLIRTVAAHYKEKYPQAERDWIWELWNEPDIFYWGGTPEEFMRLYDVTEKAIREVMPNATFGGPHTAFTTGDTFRPFLEHVVRGENFATPGQTGTRLDYLAYHSKGNTAFEPPARGRRGRGETPPTERHIRMNMGQNLNAVTNGFRVLADFPELRETPIIIGEMDPEGVAARSARDFPPNGYRNGSVYPTYQVSLIAHAIRNARASGVRLKGVLSWAFMFDGRDTFEGFRTLATNGIEKPVLNGFRMLSRLRGREVPVESSGALDAEFLLSRQVNFRGAPDINAFAAADASGAQAIVWNYHDDLIDVAPAPVTLEFRVPPGVTGQARVTHLRIDAGHANSFTVWRSLGAPNEIAPERAAAINEAARLQPIEPPRQVPIVDGRLTVSFDLPRHALSMIEVAWRPAPSEAPSIPPSVDIPRASR
jgi:xylan 1,4-beta-xylosidase